MSVFNLSASATIKLFNEFILPGVNTEVRENTTLYDRWGDTDTEHMVGKYALFKALIATPKSARASNTSTFPKAKQGTYDEFRLFMKRGMYATLQFDGLAMACSKGKGAVINVLEEEVMAIGIQIANKLNRQFWGDGSGRLAQLSAASSNSTTVVVDGPLFGQDSNFYTDPANYMDEGMGVEIYDTSGNQEAADVAIETITDNGDGTATLVMDTAVTASNNSWIFDEDTYASSQAVGLGVPMGISGIISASDPYTGITETSFQNIDRDTNKWARAQEVDQGSTAITNIKILELIHKIERFGRAKAIFTNDVIYRAYYEILETDKTMPNEKAYWGGLEGLAFYGGKKGKIPIMYDTDCPDNEFYIFDDQHLNVYSPTKMGMQWLPADTGSILTRVQGKDESSANLLWYYNFGCPKPQSQGRLKNVKHASA